MFVFFPIQSSLHGDTLKVALQLLQCDSNGNRLFVDLINQRSEVWCAMLKSFEYVSLILYPRMTFDTLDHDKLLQLTSMRRKFCAIDGLFPTSQTTQYLVFLSGSCIC